MPARSASLLVECHNTFFNNINNFTTEIQIKTIYWYISSINSHRPSVNPLQASVEQLNTTTVKCNLFQHKAAFLNFQSLLEL